MGVYKYYSDLPTWAKGVVVVGTFAAVSIATYTIYRNIKNKKAIDEANEAAKTAKKDLEVLAKRGIKPTKMDTEYLTLATKLHQAMDGCATDENAIYAVFTSLSNDADVLKLIDAFGVRYLVPCAGSEPISYTRYLFDSKTFGGSIATWLQYDLTPGEVKKVNDILAKKSIQYRF